MGRQWPVAAAMLVLSGTALAEGPTAKPQPFGGIPLVRPHAGGPVSSAPASLASYQMWNAAFALGGPACTIQQIPVFNAALVEARARLAVAVRLVRDEPAHPHVRQWFGNAPPQVVLGRLQRTATRLANTAGFDIHCNDPARCNAGVGGYVQVWSRVLRDAQGRPAVSYRVDEGQVIGVCPPFFRATMDGVGTRWGILIHEASHVAAETQDHAYGRTDSMALARANGARAAENADNFRLFVETLPRS